jgi:hypothetical protein
MASLIDGGQAILNADPFLSCARFEFVDVHRQMHDAVSRGVDNGLEVELLSVEPNNARGDTSVRLMAVCEIGENSVRAAIVVSNRAAVDGIGFRRQEERGGFAARVHGISLKDDDALIHVCAVIGGANGAMAARYLIRRAAELRHHLDNDRDVALGFQLRPRFVGEFFFWHFDSQCFRD